MISEKRPISLAKLIVESFPRVATIYRNMRDQLDYMGKLNPTPWGFSIAGNAAMAQGIFEPKETQIVRNILKDVDILINVGANVGYYCCHALSMGKSVIAFEPIQRNLRYLCKNIKYNGWSGVEIYPIALSNAVGVVEIYGGDTGASIIKGWARIPESYVTFVPSSTMDVVLGTRLHGKRALVLVDVEGAEKSVIEGATIMLANNPKPIWVVEITTTEHQPHGVNMNPNMKSTFEYFYRNGYKAYNLDQEIHPVTMEQVELASTGSKQFTTHNFVFCESN
jgi:FkbM family methyltransferase